jgi:MerR family transcriptional regulator, light-induced transcriptional regulator
MPVQQPRYSPKQVAAALSASESSVKRWCDQGAIPTIRTVGGHRKITLDGLQEFLRNSNRGLESPQALGLPSQQSMRCGLVPGGDDPDQQLFRNALAEGDEDTCRRVIWKRVRSGELRSEVAGYLVTDAMHGFGQAWDCDQLDAYQERRGCDICVRLINELRGDLPPISDKAAVAIGGAPEGDPYQLPTALVELSLREAGWNAVSLGSNLPTDSFVQAILDYQPQLVWLSVSTISDISSFISEQIRLADHISDDVSLLVGGRALRPNLRPKLRYTAHCDDLRSLVDLASMIRPVAGR